MGPLTPSLMGQAHLPTGGRHGRSWRRSLAHCAHWTGTPSTPSRGRRKRSRDRHKPAPRRWRHCIVGPEVVQKYAGERVVHHYRRLGFFCPFVCVTALCKRKRSRDRHKPAPRRWRHCIVGPEVVQKYAGERVVHHYRRLGFFCPFVCVTALCKYLDCCDAIDPVVDQ